MDSAATPLVTVAVPRLAPVVVSTKSTDPVGVPSVGIGGADRGGKGHGLSEDRGDWLELASDVKLRYGEGSGVPLTSRMLPISGTVLEVVSVTSSPVPLTLIVLPPGLAGVPRSTRTTSDQDGRLAVAGRFLDGAVADEQAAAVDYDGRRICGGLGGHSLEDDRPRVDNDRRGVPRDDRPIGESHGPSVDDEVSRRRAALDGDIAAVDRPVGRRNAGRDDDGAAGDRRTLHRRAAVRSEVD